MKIEFLISKSANKFFFISNLTEWHFSCRHEYNSEWLKTTGPLKDPELQAIASLKQIFKKYGFSTKNGEAQYLGKIFYSLPEKEVWKQLQQQVTKRECAELTHVFALLTPRFEKAWENTGAAERKRRIALMQSTLRSREGKKALTLLDKLFSADKNEKMKIVALFSPLDQQETAAGSATIGDGALTLELPALRRRTFELAYSIGILLHETIHVIFARMGTKETIEFLIKKHNLPLRPTNDSSISTLEFVNELSVELLAPYGYIMQKTYGKTFTNKILSSKNLERALVAYKQFKKNQPLINMPLLRKYFVWKFLPKLIPYFEASAEINRNSYLEKIISSFAKEKRRGKSRRS